MINSHKLKLEKLNDGCRCNCHFGGAVSCPACKQNHETHNCEHCK